MPTASILTTENSLSPRSLSSGRHAHAVARSSSFLPGMIKYARCEILLLRAKQGLQDYVVLTELRQVVLDVLFLSQA